jgi:hypothetical protein
MQAALMATSPVFLNGASNSIHDVGSPVNHFLSLIALII